MEETTGGKTLIKRTSSSEVKSQMPAVVLVETEALKNFTIPKLRRSTNKVCLAPCNTDRREYIEMNYTLEESRFDMSYDLQSSWHFGDMKLVCNDDLEKKYAAKRSEMREQGRHGRELQEHFCFLVLSNSAVMEIYRYGMSTDGNAMKALGNPLMGVYLHRHVDVALKFAHQKSMNTGKVMIFKVLFGKVKKVHPVIEKKKVALDPTPNFDCHMSRISPSVKDPLDRQVICSSCRCFSHLDASFEPSLDLPPTLFSSPLLLCVCIFIISTCYCSLQKRFHSCSLIAAALLNWWIIYNFWMLHPFCQTVSSLWIC